MSVALVIRVRDELISDGVEEVERVYENDRVKLEGALEGFRICGTLETPDDYRIILDARHRSELASAGEVVQYGDQARVNAHWRYRYATLQVEHVFDRLRVVWGLGPTYSARAVVSVAEVLERIQP